MPDAVRVHLGADALDDDVDVVVLEILGDARHERDSHRHQQQSTGTFDERRRLVLAEAGRVVVDDVAKDERIEEREHLIRRRQHEREENQRPVFVEV